MLLALCGVFWTTAGVLIKLVDWNVARDLGCARVIAGGRAMAVRRPSWRASRATNGWRRSSLAATTGLFILANKLTTAANAILIQYSAPIWVALFGQWFLGERASRLDWLTIVAVLAASACSSWST